MYIVLLLIYKKQHVGEKIKVEKLKTLIFGCHLVQQLWVTIIANTHRL